MKIELKKIKINLTFSEETIMFQADLAVNGVVIGSAHNDGHGGCTFYSANRYGLNELQIQRNEKLLKEAEEFCKSLPPIRSEKLDFEYPMNLEHFIDELIDEELKKKEQKKFEKKMENAIMWGIPNGRSYTQVKFKVPLAKIPLIQLQGLVDKYKKEFKKGEEFLNTNLEGLGVKL